jgi:hypothetical protein
MRHTAVVRDRRFKRAHLRAEDERLYREDFVDLPAQRLSQGAILLAKVEQRYTHGAKHGSFDLCFNANLPAAAQIDRCGAVS